MVVSKSRISQLPQILLHLGQLRSKKGGASWHPGPVYVGWHGACLRQGGAGRGVGVYRQSGGRPALGQVLLCLQVGSEALTSFPTAIHT